MVKSNQQPSTECCRGKERRTELQEPGAEQPSGSVHRERSGPQTGVAPGLSNSAPRHINQQTEMMFCQSEPNTDQDRQGEGLDRLPGSKSVARAEEDARNIGRPESSRRTNCESQAGRVTQRQEEGPSNNQGIGSAHSSSTPPQQTEAQKDEGADGHTQLAQETGHARKARKSWRTSLRDIADKAKKTRGHRFGGLYQMINREALEQCFKQLRKRAACGVDGVSYQDYASELEANLEDLVKRLVNKGYHARLVRRKYIPKSPGKLRPLGIPVLEDKLVQQAAAQILKAIYEEKFHSCSYGYRDGRSAHEAIQDMTDELQWGKHNFVVEFDIENFFGNIRHDLMLEMLAKDVQDGAFLRLIEKWLKAGILEEDGKVIDPQTGTPQGGVISPILANVYLHYVLDDWFEREVRPRNRGQSRLFRYADDFVGCFEYRHEAEAFEKALLQRLEAYGLKAAPNKTKKIRFGRNGGPHNGRYDFLGFEFRWEPDRKGRPTVKRRTARKKFRASVQRFGEWIKLERHRKLSALMGTLRAKLRGTWNYYGIIGNFQSLKQFYDAAVRLLYKWLNRRSQKRSLSWHALRQILRRFQIPRPRIRRPAPSDHPKSSPSSPEASSARMSQINLMALPRVRARA